LSSFYTTAEPVGGPSVQLFSLECLYQNSSKWFDPNSQAADSSEIRPIYLNVIIVAILPMALILGVIALWYVYLKIK
jgi:hypothetical protein